MELPEQFVEEAADRSLDDLRGELQQSGMSLEEFAEANDLDEEDLRENQRVRALSSLRLHFAVEALARERDIDVTEEDVTAELQRIAAESGGDMEFVQQAAALQPNFLEEVRDRVMRRRLLAGIIEEADVEELSADAYEEYVGSLNEAEDEEAAEDTEEAAEETLEEALEEAPADDDEADEADEANQETEPSADEDVQESEDE